VYSTGGVVTITDDDQARASQLHVEGVSLLEGDQGPTTAEVRVLLEPASTNTVTVDYLTVDGTALASQDYQAAQGTLTFAPGEVLKILPIAIRGDTSPESDESFSVQLSQPKLALLGSAHADVVIANDDPIVHATIADLEVDEGNDGVKTVPITITFDHPASDRGKFQVRLVGSTAVAGQDFHAFSQTLYPPAGVTTTMTFNVEILSDADPECDEGILIQYNEVYMGDDSVKTAKLVLRNDDGPAQGCSDPFTPPPAAEPARDGGTPLPTPVDTGTSLPTPVDSGNVGSVSDAQVGWGRGTDTQAASGVGLNDVPDSGASTPRGQLGGTSGCSCSLAAPSRDAGLLVFAVAGFLAALVRRSRSR
jgi:Calx-beta domain